MRALIFNSGLGSRLGELTADRPKSMVRLPDGESIFHRQLRVLSSCGVSDFVVTTGPFHERIEGCAREFEERGCRFSFVRNDRYRDTNYIWSMWLAREHIAGGDVLMLHGDLVFDAGYVRKLLAAPAGSWGSVNRSLPQPPKDFKARVVDGEVHEVGVGIFDDDCFAFQAMYRLEARAADAWFGAISDFVARGELGVYAEDAANEVFGLMRVRELSYEGHVLDEVDTPGDLARVGAAIRERDWADQPVLMLGGGGISVVSGDAGALGAAGGVAGLVSSMGMQAPLVVTDEFFVDQLSTLFGGVLASFETFSGYAPNPTYEQVLGGVRAFRRAGCDGVVSLGGGSATDVAKCIRLWEALPGDGTDACYADVDAGYPRFPHLAIPTTAGTGSESTHFAVVYVGGEKRSVAQPAAQPSAALLAPGLLASLPGYQKRATVMDALCQAIESHWSRGSCEASRDYSARAIPEILRGVDGYLAGDPSAAERIAVAANLAGRAINLTTTTAPHALSYKLTSLFGYAHGHAVAMCMGPCWRELLGGAKGETMERLDEVAKLVTGNGDATPGDGLDVFEGLYRRMGLGRPGGCTDRDLDTLVGSVNAQRLSNFPMELDGGRIREIYLRALGAGRGAAV